MPRRTLPVLIASQALATVAATIANAAKEEATAGVSPDGYRQVEILMRAIETVRENYVDPEAVTYDKLIQGAIAGLFERLDEHSEYVTPAQLEQLRRASPNPRNTAGLTVESRAGGLLVSSVAEGGPAARAGLKAGDRLLAIGGEDASGLSAAGASALLDGPPGKSLTLEFLRPGTTRARTVGFRRQQPALDSVTGVGILPGPGARVGYARVRDFEQSTPRELAAALDGLADDGMEALVLDLRGNPGGLLESGVDLCAQFLPAATLVARTRGRPGGAHSAEYRTPATDRPVRDVPLAVLIDGESASSSEIVAGALRDHGRATLVGAKTYGKGSVQSIIQMGLDTGAAMRLTTSRFFTPKGHAIEGAGVAPDIVSDDPLAAAIAHLRAGRPKGD